MTTHALTTLPSNERHEMFFIKTFVLIISWNLCGIISFQVVSHANWVWRDMTVVQSTHVMAYEGQCQGHMWYLQFKGYKRGLTKLTNLGMFSWNEICPKCFACCWYCRWTTSHPFHVPEENGIFAESILIDITRYEMGRSVRLKFQRDYLLNRSPPQ